MKASRTSQVAASDGVVPPDFLGVAASNVTSRLLDDRLRTAPVFTSMGIAVGLAAGHRVSWLDIRQSSRGEVTTCTPFRLERRAGR
jgi:hypothetical protein